MRTRRSGFTLIELLIVVVIIGVLAAIAIPKFQSTKGKAYLTSLRSDLRNVATAQEGYFYANGVYSSSLNALNVQPSSGVTISISVANAAGWGATATHPMAFPIKCALFMGGVAAPPPASVEGSMVCQ